MGGGPFLSKCGGGWADDCVVNEQNINPKVVSSLNVSGLTWGTLYTMKAYYYPYSYRCGGRSTTYLSSCSMTPDPLNLASSGQTGTLTTGLSLSPGQRVVVSYQSSLPTVATVSNVAIPLVQWQQSHTTTVTAVSNGSTTVANTAKYITVNGEQVNSDIVCNDQAIVNVGVPTATPTNTPTLTLTPTATPTPGPWTKLKNTSFYSINNLNDPIPLAPIAYDSDDNTNAQFIIGGTAAGLVAAPSINLGSGEANSNNWSAAGFSMASSMTPTSYLSYVKARKEHKTVTGIGQVDTDGTYYFQGNMTLNNTNLSTAAASNFVLIVDGNVTINQDRFNFGADCIDTSSSKSIAILSTGTITFSNTTQCAAGVFIAPAVVTGTTVNQGLKIKGNLVAQTTLTNNRNWSDRNIPSLFVVFNQEAYLDLLPYMSTVSYEWNQTQ